MNFLWLLFLMNLSIKRFFSEQFTEERFVTQNLDDSQDYKSFKMGHVNSKVRE